MNADREIIEKLLNGWTLKTLMEPDPEIITNGPAHLENLTLKIVFVKDGHFWGHTLHQHLNIMGDYFVPEECVAIVSFLYSNIGNKKYFSIIAERIAERIYTQSIGYCSRYKSHKWVLLDDYEEIFDLSDPNAKTQVRDAILNGDDFKCALLDEKDYWHICTIHRPHFVYDGCKVYLQSDPFKMQPAFLTEEWIKMVEEEDRSLSMIDPLNGAIIEGTVIDEQYVIDLDGLYTDYNSRMNKLWQKTKMVKVFKKKLKENTRMIIYDRHC